MTTKKDLVEAHAFSRRRLVTAFLSGAPGGREVEPSRPGRTIVGGIAIAVLLIAGAAIASVLAPRTATGWDSQGVVVSKDTGERYVITDDSGQLRPVINVTSAQLLLGMNYKMTIVSQKTLDGRTPGPAIGILGAPPELPAQSSFIPTGWTACTGDDAGVAVDVSATPQVRSLAGEGLLAATPDGKMWLIAQGTQPGMHAYRYPISGQSAVQRLFTDTVPLPIHVTPAWIDLFPQESLTPPKGLTAVSNGSGGYDVVGTDASGTRVAQAVGAFAAYLIAGKTPSAGTVPSSTGDLLGNRVDVWPDRLLKAASGVTCAQLDAAPGRPALATLAAPTGADAWPAPAPRATEQPVVRVDPGAGALVRSAGAPANAPGLRFMIASTGQQYLLNDPATVDTLGLTSYAAPTVSPPWMALFQRGPELTQRAARCEPQLGGGDSC